MAWLPDPLAGISPWWWIAAAILLAALEMLTISTVLIWSALAAALTAAALWFWPGLSTAGQISIFALLSIAFIFIGRALLARYGDGAGDEKRLNRRADQLVGREAIVQSVSGHEGHVTVDDVPWPARFDGDAPSPAPGDRVRIIAADGIVVRVTPV